MVRDAKYHYTSHLHPLLCFTAPFVTWRLYSCLNPKGIPALVYYISEDHQEENMVTREYYDKKERKKMQNTPYKDK